MFPAISHFNIIGVLVFCQLLAEADIHQCESQYSIFGMMLRGHTFKRLNASISFECHQACNDDFRCQSFHFVIKKNACELNNRTKEARPEDFIPDWHRYYFRRNNGMGKFVSNKGNVYINVGRRGGLVVNALVSGSSGPGSSPGREHCVVFLGNSHSASLQPAV